MNSAQRGAATSYIEVTNITNIGFWLLVEDHEYFVPFADYPVFNKATVIQIYAIEQLAPKQFHWPELDAYIELEALAHPEKYSLVFCTACGATSA